MMPAKEYTVEMDRIESAGPGKGIRSFEARSRSTLGRRVLSESALALLWLGLALMAGPVLALEEDDGYRPEPNSIVHTLTSTPFGTLVGGNFTAIAGESRGKWAMLDAAGEATPYPQLGFSSGVVLAGLQTTNASGVAETVIAGSLAGHIRRFNLLGEPAIPWSAPNPDGTIRALAEQPVTSGAPGVYIAGEFSTVNGQTRRRVALLNANGSHSTSFLPPNFTGTAHALAVQDDGKVLVGGSLGIVLTPQRLYRLNPDGSLDASFQPVSMSSGNRTVYAIEVEDDGRILVAGALDGNGFIVRLNPDGSLDDTYEPPGLNGPVYALDLLPDGRALIGGDFTSGVGLRSRIARLNESGSVDNGFGLFVNPNGPVRAVLVQDDGSVLIGGGFNQIGNLGRSHLARLDARGVVDQPLVADANNDLLAVSLERDGRILVGGSFTEISGSSRSRLARLNPNGSVNSSYAPILNGYVKTMAVQRDGRVLIGGGFGSVDGVARRRMARLHSDGSLDTSFEAYFDNPDGVTWVSAIHLYDDGRMLVGGVFDSVNGQPREGLVRLLQNGAVDPSFDPVWLTTEASNDVRHLVVDDAGWIYAGGGMTRPEDDPVGGPERTLALLSPSGQQSPSFLPSLGEAWRGYVPDAVELTDDNILVGGQIRYRLSALGPWQRGWTVLDTSGNHTSPSPFPDGRIFTIHKRGSGFWIGGRFFLDDPEERLGVGLMTSAGDALQAGLAPLPLGSVASGQMTSDGRFLAAQGIWVNGDPVLKRIANPDGLPLRQRIVWGTPGQPERLVWDRMTGFGSAPAVLGTPRVLVSQTCCDADDFVPAAGGGWMSRDGDDWRLDGFAGLPGKFYVRIEYRAGNSTGSSTFLTPIQRFYGEVPPGVDTADLSLKLIIDQDPVEPGDAVIVDVLASNAGPDLAGLPSVSIDLPVGYTLLAFDDSDQGTFLPDEMLWKLDDLAGSGPAADALLRLQLQVTQQTPYAIEAQIFAAEFDPNLNNNVARLTPDVQRSRSDLKLVHSVSPAAALPGDQVTFVVGVDNLGPEPADGVEVAHLLPTGYSYQSHNSDLGSYNSATGQWQIGGLDVGEGALLEVAALVNGAGGFMSSASASSLSEDPEPFNNLAFAEIDQFTDLAVSIEADSASAAMNDPLAMTVEVVNNGARAADATSVQVQTLSGGFIPFEHFASIGDYEPNSGLWTVGSLAPGETATLVIDGTPGFPEDTEVGATVSSAAFDLDPSNDSASVLVSYPIIGPVGDFSPSLIDFGDVAVGQFSQSSVVQVFNVGAEPLQIASASLWGDDIEHFVIDGSNCPLSPLALSPEESCVFWVRFNPQAEGTWINAEVRVSTNDPNSPFVVPIRGNGLSDSVEDAIFSDRFQGFQ